jgi:hypothetical protein
MRHWLEREEQHSNATLNRAEPRPDAVLPTYRQRIAIEDLNTQKLLLKNNFLLNLLQRKPTPANLRR